MGKQHAAEHPEMVHSSTNLIGRILFEHAGERVPKQTDLSGGR